MDDGRNCSLAYFGIILAATLAQHERYVFLELWFSCTTNIQRNSGTSSVADDRRTFPFGFPEMALQEPGLSGLSEEVISDAISGAYQNVTAPWDFFHIFYLSEKSGCFFCLSFRLALLCFLTHYVASEIHSCSVCCTERFTVELLGMGTCLAYRYRTCTRWGRQQNSNCVWCEMRRTTFKSLLRRPFQM